MRGLRERGWRKGSAGRRQPSSTAAVSYIGRRGKKGTAGGTGAGGGAGRSGAVQAGAGREPGWGAAVLLAVAIFAGLLALAGRTTLWDRDEPRFAQATVEMLASGDYLVPTFNGPLGPGKP